MEEIRGQEGICDRIVRLQDPYDSSEFCLNNKSKREHPATTSLDEVKEILDDTDGVIIQDDPKNNVYPMPITSHKRDEVFVGRLRLDETQPNTLNMWIVADNLRKGAATNAVQVAEYLMEHHLAHSVR